MGAFGVVGASAGVGSVEVDDEMVAAAFPSLGLVPAIDVGDCEGFACGGRGAVDDNVFRIVHGLWGLSGDSGSGAGSIFEGRGGMMLLMTEDLNFSSCT